MVPCSSPSKEEDGDEGRKEDTKAPGFASEDEAGANGLFWASGRALLDLESCLGGKALVEGWDFPSEPLELDGEGGAWY